MEADGVLVRRSKREWLLAPRFFQLAGIAGEYTRRRGLSSGEHELLLLKHLKEFGPTSMADLNQVAPSLSRKEVLKLLQSLRAGGKVVMTGAKRGAKWAVTGTEVADNTGDATEGPAQNRSKL